MSLLDRLAAAFRPPETKINPAYAGMIMYTDSPKPISMPKNYASYAKEGYRGDDTVYKCVSYIARNGAAIPAKLYTDASKEKEIISHPLLDRLNNPNNEQSGVDYLEAVISYLLISGNSYQYAIRASKNGPPDELWVMRPDYVQIIPSPTRGVVGYKYQFFDAPIDPANILHLKFWSPDNDLYGASPLEVVAILVDQQTAAKKWNLALLQNNARPPGAWVVPTVLSKNERDRLEQKLKEKFQGYRNAGAPPVLDGGLQWQDMAHSPDDLDWLEALKYISGTIANIFNIPPPLIGDTSASTYNNMKEAKQASYTEAIFPTLDKVYAGWNAWLVPMYPDLARSGACLGYDKESVEVVREIVQQEHQAEREAAIERWQDGLATLNETREALGLEPVDGGDVYRVGSILVPAEKLMDYAEQSLSRPAAPPPAAPEPLNVQPGAAPTAPGAPAAHSGSEPGAAPGKSYRRPFVKAPVLDLVTKEQKQAYAASLELQRLKWEAEAARRLQDYFTQEKQTVVAAIRNAAMPDTADVWIEHALQQNAPDLKSLLVKLYQDIGGDIGNKTLKELKSVDVSTETKELAQDDIQQYLDMYGPDVLIYLLQLAGQKVQQINATTLAELQDLLHQGVLAGDSIPNLAQRVDSLYLQQIIPNRSTVIARTETIAASNYGSHEAAKQSGLTLKKVWLATEDARTRPDHAAADGQEVDLDEPFTVGGAQLMYPGDVSRGAPGNEVIQCRCTQIYKRVQQLEAKHLPGRHDQATHGRRRTFAPKEPFHTTNPSDRLKEREATLTKACNAWQKKLNADEDETPDEEAQKRRPRRVRLEKPDN